MERTTALIWSWLNVLNYKRYKALKDEYGNLDAALSAISPEMLRSLGCKEETMMIALNRMDDFDPAQYEAELLKRDVSMLSIEDDAYPSLLRAIPDPPVFLCYRGDLSILNQPCMGLVGSRDMSAYGKRVTEELVPAIVRAGMTTVSGLAHGIDTCVANETIDAGGKSVAVLGHGLAMISPKQKADWAKRVVESGGLILSEYALDITANTFTFPARNRIIAGLSLGTIVLEAGEGSGSLITADLALEYGREVFAVPGAIFDPHYAGCHQIITKGHAKLITCAQDALNEIGIVAAESSEKNCVYTPANDTEKVILEVLTTMPQSAGDIGEKSGLEMGTMNAALTMMELAGAVKNVGNGQWVRS